MNVNYEQVTRLNEKYATPFLVDLPNLVSDLVGQDQLLRVRYSASDDEVGPVDLEDTATLAHRQYDVLFVTGRNETRIVGSLHRSSDSDKVKVTFISPGGRDPSQPDLSLGYNALEQTIREYL